jgi:uncharacterized membrane protein YeaQ/YmgE (transglycosylase-associated protein family)
MNIIAWIVLGIIAGAIAKAIYPGSQGGGILATMVLGIIGAFVGGSVATFLSTGKLALTAAGTGLSILASLWQYSAQLLQFLSGVLLLEAATHREQRLSSLGKRKGAGLDM